MNTITIMSTVEGTPNVTYTEGEVARYIEKARAYDDLNDLLTKQRDTQYKVKNLVRDFFSEGQWDDGEFSASKDNINELLESIGCNRLTSTYEGTFTITGTFNVEAETSDDAENLFKDNVDVSFYDGDITVDYVEVDDVREDE